MPKKKIQIRDSKWFAADALNESNQPRQITKNFNAELERIRKDGFTYCPF